MSDGPITYAFAGDDLAVVVHFEGTVYSFNKNGAPLASVTNQRSRAIIRALLESALADLEALQ